MLCEGEEGGGARDGVQWKHEVLNYSKVRIADDTLGGKEGEPQHVARDRV